MFWRLFHVKFLKSISYFYIKVCFVYLSYIVVHIHSYPLSEEVSSDTETHPVKDEDDVTNPRGTVPQPFEYEPINLSMSPIPQEMPKKNIEGSLDISSESSAEENLGLEPIMVRSAISNFICLYMLPMFIICLPCFFLRFLAVESQVYCLRERERKKREKRERERVCQALFY